MKKRNFVIYTFSLEDGEQFLENETTDGVSFMTSNFKKAKRFDTAHSANKLISYWSTLIFPPKCAGKYHSSSKK